MTPLDLHGRPLGSLRVSVTDRCNLRCAYCMPEHDYTWLPRSEILSFEEIAALVRLFASLGVDKVRLTGGEPLLRRDLPLLLRLLAGIRGIRDLALTTNGMLLAGQVRALAEAGLQRVTVSLDTLREERFRALTRREGLGRVLAGIEAAADVLGTVKINTVVMRGVNDDEIAAMVGLARETGSELRLIEYMDVGGATCWSKELVVSRTEILASLARSFGKPVPVPGRQAAPAERFALPDGTVVGVIASTTAPFCAACDRGRLTADGMFYLCLYAATGTDLRAAMRSGSSDDELRELIARVWRSRADRGAVERLGLAQRAPLVSARGLLGDPHLEMHTRGG